MVYTRHRVQDQCNVHTVAFLNNLCTRQYLRYNHIVRSFKFILKVGVEELIDIQCLFFNADHRDLHAKKFRVC
jgi:hypothetical protein